MKISHGLCVGCFTDLAGHPPKSKPKYGGEYMVVCSVCEKTLYDPRYSENSTSYRGNEDPRQGPPSRYYRNPDIAPLQSELVDLLTHRRNPDIEPLQNELVSLLTHRRNPDIDPLRSELVDLLTHRRNPVCAHGFYEDPAGWGTGCPQCELLIWCENGQCDLPECHHCNPQFDCEYGHEECYEMEDSAKQEYFSSSFDYFDDEDEDEDEDDPYWCGDCKGTGIGYPPPDARCGRCGGTGSLYGRRPYYSN